MPTLPYRYLLAILVLGVYAGHLQYQKNRRAEVYEDLLKTVTQANETIRDQMEGVQSEIAKNADAYRCPHNDRLLQKAKFITLQLDSLYPSAFATTKGSWSGAKRSVHAPTLFNNGVWDARQITFYFQEQTKFVDSLRFFAAKDSNALVKLQSALLPAQERMAQQVLNGSRDDQKQALFAARSLLHAALGSQVMACLENQKKGSEMAFDRFFPMIDFDKSCIQAGETFEGVVFACAYSSQADNVRMFVNGDLIPIRAGLGEWTQVYQTPGQKKATVKIDVKNPLTGVSITYTKQFSITVCQ